MRPVRVVAPTSVNRGSSRRIERADGPLADHDVELEVLHRGIEHLFDRPRETVDLVDEQHVAVVEVGEDGGEITGPLERGPARDAEAHSHLGRDDPRQGGLAETGRTREEEVVDGLAAPARGSEQDLEVLLEAAADRRTRRGGAGGA